MASQKQRSKTLAYFKSSVDEFQEATKHLHNQYEMTLVADVLLGRGIGVWIELRGQHLFWLNRTNDYRAMLVIPCANLGSPSDDQVWRAALELTHGLAVATDSPVALADWWFGSGCRRWPPPRQEHFTLCSSAQDVLPVIESGFARKSKEAIAVACYAAGRNSPDCMFEFLSYYRILEVIFGKNTDRVGKKMTNRARAAWVNATLPQLLPHYHGDRVRELVAAGVTDFDEYLYETNRCAIAHAADLTSVADPSDPADIRRVAEDVNLMRTLVRKAMIDHLPNAGCDRL